MLTTTIKKLAKRLNPVARYGPCIGVTLFRWRRFKIELWYAPADFATPEHTHENSSSEFLILYARTRFIYRRTVDFISTVDGKVRYRTEGYVVNVPPFRRTLTVRAGTPHAFHRGESCMVWLCFERWKKNVPVTSVAEDFQLT